MRVLADTAFNPDSPWSYVQTGGVIGLLVFLTLGFLRGWVVPGFVVREKDAAITARDSELAESRKFIRDELMPLLTRTQDVLAKTLEERAWDERARRQHDD